MSAPDEYELATIHRRNVLSNLQLLASHEAQLDYQRRVPIAYVTAELFCLWHEHYWPQSGLVELSFSREEAAAVQRFDETMNRVSASLPDPLPSIDEFIELPVSSLLVAAASLALESFPPLEREKILRDGREALEAMDAKRQEAKKRKRGCAS